jgi:TRAP-type C4-dicarboxylate transport system permease small subunit
MASNMLGALNRLADRLIDLSAFIGTLGLIVEVGVILTDVIGRAFGAPLRGAQDISTMAMVLVVFGGMALCDKVGGHIAVDLFENTFPRWAILLGDLLSALIGAVIFVLIAWTLWESAALSRMLNLSTNIINLPKAWFQYAMVAMSLITALGMLLRAAGILGGGATEHRDMT